MGGGFEVIAHGVPPGLGSHVQWDRKLDGRLGAGVDVHSGDQGGRHRPRTARRFASGLEDSRRDPAPRSARPSPSGIALARPTNNAGGLEGGITNGEDLRVTGVHEADRDADETAPIRRSGDRWPSVLPTVERSDVCAVPGGGGRRRSDGGDRAGGARCSRSSAATRSASSKIIGTAFRARTAARFAKAQ